MTEDEIERRIRDAVWQARAAAYDEVLAEADKMVGEGLANARLFIWRIQAIRVQVDPALVVKGVLGLNVVKACAVCDGRGTIQHLDDHGSMRRIPCPQC